MFQKIGAIIEFIFTAAIGVACGLVCYYYVWQSGWTMVGKVFAMIGFCLWALFAMFWTIMFGIFMADGYITLDKDNVEFAIIAMITAFIIPGLIYLIDLFVDGRSSKHNTYEPSGPTYTVPKVKKKVEEYNPDDDPAIIKKPQETRKPKGAPGSSVTTTTTAKKKMVK